MWILFTLSFILTFAQPPRLTFSSRNEETCSISVNGVTHQGRNKEQCDLLRKLAAESCTDVPSKTNPPTNCVQQVAQGICQQDDNRACFKSCGRCVSVRCGFVGENGLPVEASPALCSQLEKHFGKTENTDPPDLNVDGPDPTFKGRGNSGTNQRGNVSLCSFNINGQKVEGYSIEDCAQFKQAIASPEPNGFPNDRRKHGSHSLSTGAIVGIVFGVVGYFVLLGVVILIVMKRRRNQTETV
jgi:hypothetical protein